MTNMYNELTTFYHFTYLKVAMTALLNNLDKSNRIDCFQRSISKNVSTYIPFNSEKVSLPRKLKQIANVSQLVTSFVRPSIILRCQWVQRHYITNSIRKNLRFTSDIFTYTVPFDVRLRFTNGLGLPLRKGLGLNPSHCLRQSGAEYCTCVRDL